MSYAEKIAAMRRAIGAVIVATTPGMGLSEKIDVLEMMYGVLRGFEAMLPYDEPAEQQEASNNAF